MTRTANPPERQTNLAAKLDVHLLRHPLGHTHGSHTPWLCAPYLADFSVALFMQILGYLHSTSDALMTTEGTCAMGAS